MPKTKLIKPVKIEDLLTIKEASLKLGRGYSPGNINKLIARGEWVQGTHYFKTSSAKNAVIRISVEAVEEWIAQINAS